MENERLYDITEVCALLGITSRTLRFYEEKRLINSTKRFSSRRKYTQEQIDLIKKILVLRSLGLTVAKISEIQKGDSNLSQAIIERRAEIIAKLSGMARSVRLLDEALHTIEHGGDIYGEHAETCGCADNETATLVTDLFIKGEYEKIFGLFGKTMREYTPLSALKSIFADALLPLGKFVSLERIERDCNINTVFYSRLRYKKLGLVIKFVVQHGEINGLWLSYYEL